MLQSLVAWTEKYFGSWGGHGLFWFSFLESSVFPLPVELLMVPLIIASPENWLYYTAICTLGSVIGGVFGYYLGLKLGLPLLKLFINEAKIKKVHDYFQKYEAWAVFIGAFTPLPYKVFTIGGGVFYISLKVMVIASIIGRGLRYFIIGGIVALYGQPVVDFLNVHFNISVLVICAVSIVCYLFYNKYKKGKWLPIAKK